MDLTWLLDRVGESEAALLAGLFTGLIFGVAAQRSRFCLRAACVSFARGRLDEKVAVWLLCFATALAWTQGFELMGLTTLQESRFLSSPGSLSGAMIGGVIFGAGMVMARGCSGRLLVLAATGNLRALLAGLVFAVTAQMSMDGVLAPLRRQIGGLWLAGPENVELAAWAGLDQRAGLALGLAVSAVALLVAIRAGVRARTLLFGSGVGFAVGVGWLLTSSLAAQSFEPAGIESITFSGPSADMLMFTLLPGARMDFDIGLIPGVFIGSAVAALLTREFVLEGFESALSMRRYLIGAAFMGFGAMLAGGCAIGNGVTGTSALALSAWVALSGFWIGAAVTDILLDQPGVKAGAAPEGGGIARN